MKTTVSEIAAGSGRYFLSGLAGSASTFLIALMVARFLGRDGLGVFSTAFMMVMIGVLLSDLGMNSFIVREFAKAGERASPGVGSLLRSRLVVAIAVSAVLVAGSSLFLPVGRFGVVIASSAILIVSRSASGVFESYIKSRLRSGLHLAIAVCTGLLQCVLVAIVLLAGRGVGAVLCALSGVEVARSAFLFAVLHEEIGEKREHGTLRQGLGPVLVQSLPFAIMAVLSLISDRADIFLLAAFRGAAEAGVYSAADRFLMVGNLVDFALFSYALPLFSSITDRGEIDRLTRRMLAGLMSLAIVGGVVLYVAAPALLRLTFRFSESALPLGVLAFSLPALFANSLARSALCAARLEKTIARIFGVACVLNLALNILIIPRFGAGGTAVVAVVTEYFVTGMYAILYFRNVVETVPVPLRPSLIRET